MSNDKQGRNNLIRIAARRGAAMCQCRIALRADILVTGELFKRTSAVWEGTKGGNLKTRIA